MSELRAAREAAGLSIEEAAQRTRIPQRYLEALERGDHSVFPPGPFLSGYTRQYRTFLQLPERAAAPPPASEPAPRRGWSRPPSGPGRRPPEAGDDRTAPALPSRSSRTRVVRLVALGALASVAALLALAILDASVPEEEPMVGVAPDQKVTLAVVEPVRARVEADGKALLDGALLPGPARTFEAHDRLEVELQTLNGVTITYNGRALTPLGARSHGRRLLFIDDAGR